MLTPQIKSQVKLFTNEGINENVFRQNGSEGQKISGSLFNVTEDKLLGNKVKSNDSIFQSMVEQHQASQDDFTLCQIPGKHFLSDGTIVTVNKQRQPIKYEYNTYDKNKRFTIEQEYGNEGDLSKKTYKDNNNRVRYTEEYTRESYVDENRNNIRTEKTTVRDSKGNVVYVMTVKKVISYDEKNQMHQTVEVTCKDVNGKEISVDQAFEKRDKLRTPAMRENNRDNVERFLMSEF